MRAAQAFTQARSRRFLQVYDFMYIAKSQLWCTTSHTLKYHGSAVGTDVVLVRGIDRALQVEPVCTYVEQLFQAKPGLFLKTRLS